MKYFRLLFLFFIGILLLPSCSRVKPNYEGVLMTNCGRNGLEDFKIVSGRINTMAPCKDLYQVPMFEQTGDIDQLPLVLSDGSQGFSVDPSYSYQAIRGKGPEIIFQYKQYGPSSPTQFFDSIEDAILRARIQEAYKREARNYSPDELLNNMEKFEANVRTKLEEVFEEAYFKLTILSSGLTPPAALAKSIERKNQAITDTKIELERMEQEKARLATDLEKAKLQLEIEKVNTQVQLEKSRGLTPEILEELKIKAWDKAGCPIPQVITSENAGNLIFSLKK